MARKRNRKQQPKPAPTSKRRNMIIVIGILLSLLAGNAALAYRGKWRASSLAAPQPQSLSLSKEYVYAGGRLLATEEPTPACSPTVVPPTTRNFPAAGGTDSVSVTAAAGCTWTAASNNPTWITITAPANGMGTGNGTVTYTVAPNTGSSQLTGTMTIAGQMITVVEAPAHAYQGFLDGAGCNVIAGWAWDGNNPNTTVSVDIYDGSTLVVAAVPAGMYREDLLNVLASPNHGFSYPTPASLKNGAHSINVKVAGTQVAIGSTGTLHCTEMSPALQGSFDGIGCDTVCGWAWDGNDPANIVNVDIYDGSTLIGTIAATQYRQDLVTALGSPYHGFTFPTPAGLKNGQTHAITVKFGGTSTNLTWNNPRNFNSTCSTPPSFQGSLDPVNCTQISGYAWDANSDLSTINVAIYLDGNFQVVVPAQQVYQHTPPIGDGYHGFIFAVPASWKGNVPHSVSVKISGTNTFLSNSPQGLKCP